MNCGQKVVKTGTTLMLVKIKQQIHFYYKKYWLVTIPWSLVLFLTVILLFVRSDQHIVTIGTWISNVCVIAAIVASFGGLFLLMRIRITQRQFWWGVFSAGLLLLYVSINSSLYNHQLEGKLVTWHGAHIDRQFLEGDGNRNLDSSIVSMTNLYHARLKRDDIQAKEFYRDWLATRYARKTKDAFSDVNNAENYSNSQVKRAYVSDVQHLYRQLLRKSSVYYLDEDNINQDDNQKKLAKVVAKQTHIKDYHQIME